MLRLRPYTPELLKLVSECAQILGIFVHTHLRLRNATDGVIALLAGYPTATFGSVDRFKMPTDYHWPTDTPDRVNYRSVVDASRLAWAMLRRL